MGDRVLVESFNLVDNSGPAMVERLVGERGVRVLFDSGDRDEVPVIRLKREDDDETAGGTPLWCWH